MATQAVPAYVGPAAGHVGQVYNEAAFRHFLILDRRRAQRARRSLLLLLVTLGQTHGPRPKLANATAAALFVGLGDVVREVDYLGWYREGYVAGAVLAQGASTPSDVPQLIAERVVPVLKQRLSADVASHLRVRVVRLGARVSN